MKKNEVVIGGSYLAKVSGKVVPVKILDTSKYGGWEAMNTETSKHVRIKSARRLRAAAGKPKTEAKPAKSEPPKVEAPAAPDAAGNARSAAADLSEILSKTGSEFTDALNKASIEQLTKAATLDYLTPKQRSRIEATLKARTDSPAPPAGGTSEPAMSLATVENKRISAAQIVKADGGELSKLLAAAPLKALKEVLADTTISQEKRLHIEQTFRVRNAPLPAKREKAAKAPKAEGKMSGLDAAAKVLAEAGQPLNAKQIVEAMKTKGYWSSNAATPHATIYAAMLIEARKKGNASRFVKTDRGLWTVTDAGKNAE